MQNGFMRVAACSPSVHLADTAANVTEILDLSRRAADQGAEVAVFPEMSLTGYTCADLFHNRRLTDDALAGLLRLADELDPRLGAAIVGLPLRMADALYNCAAVVARGHIYGIVPKTYLPDYNEFYEKRWFAAAPAAVDAVEMTVCGAARTVPVGTDLLFDIDDVPFAIELCEDLWAPVPPSCRHTLAGARVVFNLSASDDVIGKYDYLLSLISQQSARCLSAYVYASAGYGESTTDLVFDGKTIIAENGRILQRNTRWNRGNQMAVADIDIEAIERDRMHLRTFDDCRRNNPAAAGYRTVKVNLTRTPEPDFAAEPGALLRHVDPMPFVPGDTDRLSERCEEIVHIQTTGLSRRLQAARCRSLVIGISGGLDSTLALLVAARAFDESGMDRRDIIGVTMPGFGTTGRTHTNSLRLMQALGVTMREISIVPAVQQHFADIGHDPAVHDVTYENSQARQRTLLLMDIANQTGGMVLGTGDLSELALGWATYNGDHMSMYGVNAGVPKTLVRHLVRYFALSMADRTEVAEVLLDIVDTPISPELIPADKDDNITQKTEDIVGPYELHDFFLYYTLRYGYGPDRILLLARKAFAGRYDDATITRWLDTFMRRFFAQQFKRSCLPDGPKVGSVTLSPRGDWRMPSDAASTAWLRR